MTPTNHPDADVAAIARGLTEQMRYALTWPKAAEIIPRTLYAQTIAGLERRRLVARTNSLTPLGRAVREHLLKKESNNA